MATLDPTQHQSPRGAPTLRRDDRIDAAWAFNRFTGWLTGGGPLSIHLFAFVLVAIGTILLSVYRDPSEFSLPNGLIGWGVIVAVHTALVVVAGVIRQTILADRPEITPDVSRPMYPDNRRQPPNGNVPTGYTGSATSQRTRPAHDATNAPWRAPITTLPVPPSQSDRRGDTARQSGIDIPPVPEAAGTDADTAQQNGSNRFRPSRPTSLEEVRNVLAGDDPAWRRWIRSIRGKGSDQAHLVGDTPADRVPAGTAPHRMPQASGPPGPAGVRSAQGAPPPQTGRTQPAALQSDGWQSVRPRQRTDPAQFTQQGRGAATPANGQTRPAVVPGNQDSGTLPSLANALATSDHEDEGMFSNNKNKGKNDSGKTGSNSLLATFGLNGSLAPSWSRWAEPRVAEHADAERDSTGSDSTQKASGNDGSSAAASEPTDQTQGGKTPPRQ